MTTPKKKTWCRHIVWEAIFRGDMHMPEMDWKHYYKDAGYHLTTVVAKSWKLCPICGKERPKG